MVFPHKHVRLSESLLGLGSFVLETLDAPKTIDTVWKDYSEVNDTARFPAYHTFEHVVLTVVFLYSIGAIEEDELGKLSRCDSLS